MCHKCQTKRRSSIGVGPDLVTGVLLRGKLDTETHTQGERHVNTEAETGAMCLRTKERRGLLATPRSWERGMEQLSLREASRRNQPCQHLDFGLLTSRTAR